jgi:hypothetical protein
MEQPYRANALARDFFSPGLRRELGSRGARRKTGLCEGLAVAAVHVVPAMRDR